MNSLTGWTLSVFRLILLVFAKRSLSKEPILPLCPNNLMNFLPQDLPMHCRMPIQANSKNDLQRAQRSTASQVPPVPFPFPPGAGSLPPGAIPMQMPIMPGAPAIPASPVGPPIPMPVMPGSPGGKLPVIVMPFYSPDPSYKELKKSKKKSRKQRRRPKRYRRPAFADTDSDTDTETDSSDADKSTSTDSSSEIWKASKGAGRRRRFKVNRDTRRYFKKRKGKGPSSTNILTPVLQYVTKDGYVIFEKEISKNEAKDWLSVNKEKEKNKEIFVEKPNIQKNSSKQEITDSGGMNDTDNEEVNSHKTVIKEDKKNEKRAQLLKSVRNTLTNRLPVVHKKKISTAH